ncbi:MAG: glycosyltransferase, partial [Bacteroidota bacterium]
AINSLLTMDNEGKYELIIINDGSTNISTLKILKEIENRGLLVINQKNKGLSAARNEGIKIAKGKYILPLDSDNKIKTDHLLSSIEVLENNPQIGVVYGNAEYFGEKKGLWKNKPFDILELLKVNYIDACAIFRKSIWEEVGGYDEKMLLGSEDWDFWIRIAMRGWRFHYVNEVLFEYRVRKDSMVNTITRPNYEAIKKYIFSKPEYKLAKAWIEQKEKMEDKKWLFKQFLRLLFKIK